MAAKNPTEALKRFLNQLKRQKSSDVRLTRAEFENREGFESLYPQGKNMLLREWQVWDHLMMHSADPCREGARFCPFAPCYQMDKDTMLVTLFFVECEEWTVYLIWHSGSKHYFRHLSDDEADTVSEWNHRILRSNLGFDIANPPPDGPDLKNW